MSAVEIAQDRAQAAVQVEYCGEWFAIENERVFSIGRGGDLDVDDNRFLHRNFLQIVHREGLWWLRNVGSRLSATITDGGGRVQAWLSPGAQLPIVFKLTTVIFSAGPTTYEFTIHASEPAFTELSPIPAVHSSTTVGAVTFTASQHLVMLALAEPMLRREGSGMSDIPTTARAAARLGWTRTRFNRKLDNVCDKLDRAGVNGLHGGATEYATNRRSRLVEHAVAARLVTVFDLPLLDQPQPQEADAGD